MAEPGVLDEDDNPRLGVGPGFRRRSPGAVIEAYADGAIDRACANCGAEPLQFCRHDNGDARKIPCAKRLLGDSPVTNPLAGPERRVGLNLLGAIQGIQAAVHRLVEPTPTYVNNTFIEIPGLYAQLHSAVTEGQQTNTGGGGGGLKSRPPMWVDAADQLHNIDLMVNVWPTGYAGSTVMQLRALAAKRWSVEDIAMVRRLTGILNAWADDIVRLLNYEHVKYISAACPVCGASTVQHFDSGGQSVHSPALKVVTELGATCQNCEHHWAPNRYIDLCRDLGFPLPDGVLE